MSFDVSVLLEFIGHIRPVIEKIELRVVERFVACNFAQLGNLDVCRCDGAELAGVVGVKTHAVQIVQCSQFCTGLHIFAEPSVHITGGADTEDRGMRRLFPDDFCGGNHVLHIEFRTHIEVGFVHDFVDGNPFSGVFYNRFHIATPDRHRRDLHHELGIGSRRILLDPDQLLLQPFRAELRLAGGPVLIHPPEDGENLHAVLPDQVDTAVEDAEIEAPLFRFQVHPFGQIHAAPVADEAAPHQPQHPEPFFERGASHDISAARLAPEPFKCGFPVDRYAEGFRRMDRRRTAVPPDAGEHGIGDGNELIVPSDRRGEGSFFL